MLRRIAAAVHRTVLTRRPDLATASAAPQVKGAAWCAPHCANVMVISSPAAVEVLVSGLSHMLRVVNTPMPDTVAKLDTSSERWVLYLDSDSPPEDLCWAMLDVLGVLVHGRHATSYARPVTHLRLLPGGGGTPSPAR
jgi:hypothetical protein